jgi:hypothetical protein
MALVEFRPNDDGSWTVNDVNRREPKAPEVSRRVLLGGFVTKVAAGAAAGSLVTVGAGQTTSGPATALLT